MAKHTLRNKAPTKQESPLFRRFRETAGFYFDCYFFTHAPKFYGGKAIFTNRRFSDFYTFSAIFPQIIVLQNVEKSEKRSDVV